MKWCIIAALCLGLVSCKGEKMAQTSAKGRVSKFVASAYNDCPKPNITVLDLCHNVALAEVTCPSKIYLVRCYVAVAPQNCRTIRTKPVRVEESR
jgi:hypothetical protein